MNNKLLLSITTEIDNIYSIFSNEIKLDLIPLKFKNKIKLYIKKNQYFSKIENAIVYLDTKKKEMNKIFDEVWNEKRNIEIELRKLNQYKEHMPNDTQIQAAINNYIDYKDFISNLEEKKQDIYARFDNIEQILYKELYLDDIRKDVSKIYKQSENLVDKASEMYIKLKTLTESIDMQKELKELDKIRLEIGEYNEL